MSYVTLATAKLHLSVVHDEDDTLIQQCIDAAESYCAAFMGRAAISDIQHCPWAGGNDCTSSSESAPTAVPAAVVQAVLMYTAEFYEHRNVTATGSPIILPFADRMLHFHRVGLGF